MKKREGKKRTRELQFMFANCLFAEVWDLNLASSSAYRGEIDKINTDARVSERGIIGVIDGNAPSIVVLKVRVSVVEVV